MNYSTVKLQARTRCGAATLAMLLGAAALGPAVALAKTPTTLVHVVGHFPAHSVSGRQAITVSLSQPAQVSDKQLRASVAGTWKQTGPRTVRFTPTTDYPVGVNVQIKVGSSAQVRISGTTNFQLTSLAAPGELIDDLIALRYLPVERSSSGGLTLEPGWPAMLHTVWNSDRGEMIKGALMALQSQHGLAMSGEISSSLWSVIDEAIAHRTYNTAGYTYAVGDQTEPETLTVWHNGRVVVHEPANTGIAASPTEPGTYAVYERLRAQVMTGTNPDGEPYSDPVQWVAYFNGGDAVHYIYRAEYGYPQSLGCIETSWTTAEHAWGYLTYGSLVTVTPET